MIGSEPINLKDWGARILVTGGSGFIGAAVIEKLVDRGCPSENILAPSKKECDLRVLENVIEITRNVDLIIHLAATVGGIGFSSRFPATQYRECTQIDLNIFNAAVINNVQKVVAVSSACAYPLEARYPLTEDQIFLGRPQETNGPYGFAKRMLLVQAEAYMHEHGLLANVVIPTNGYGPRDNFDPEYSHVIPNLIRKCLTEKEVTVWGDGSPTRDFLYVTDFAEGIVLSAERNHSTEPINLGTGEEVAIRDLVHTIAEITAFKGRIVYDKSKPNGQPRRVLDISKARERLGFRPAVSLREGIQRTVDWYKNNLMRNP